MSETKSSLLSKLKEKKIPESKKKIEIQVPKLEERVLVAKVIDKTGTTKIDREEILRKLGKKNLTESEIFLSKKKAVSSTDSVGIDDKLDKPPSKSEISLTIKEEGGLEKEGEEEEEEDEIAQDADKPVKLSEVKSESESEQEDDIAPPAKISAPTKSSIRLTLKGQIKPPSLPTSIKLKTPVQNLSKEPKLSIDTKKNTVKPPSIIDPTTKLIELTDEELSNINNKLPKKGPQILKQAPSYYLNNRERFVTFIQSLLDDYSGEIAESSEQDCSRKDSKFELLTHQKIVRDYINILTPYRGLLLFHGLGSGKTCSSIAIAEGIKENKQVVIMLPASLETNYREELKKCGDSIYKKNQYWEFVSTQKNPKLEVALSEILNIPIEYIKKNKPPGAWFVDVNKPSNYELLRADEKVSLEKQLNLMINSKYSFIRYNGYNLRHWRRDSNNGRINPFDNKVIIIDEAHNLISRIVNKLSSKKENMPMTFFKALISAENCRIVMLTGTPIINYPNEIGVMMSILRGYIKTWSFNLERDKGQPINQANLNKILQENPISNHLLDYIQIKITEQKNTLKVTRNPFGFWSVKDGINYKGVKLDPQGNLDDNQFLVAIKEILAENNIEIRGEVSVENNTALPINEDNFNAWFVQNIGQSVPKVQNMNVFKRRVLGLVSFFPDIQALLPKFNKEDPTNFIIENIPMSDFQFGIYEEARAIERKSELQSANKKAKKGDASDDLYGDSVSTYRVFSRAFCNFVFPRPHLLRPMPNDGTEISSTIKEVVTENLLDGITEEERIIKEEEVEDESSEIDELEEQADRIEQVTAIKKYGERVNDALNELDRMKNEFLIPEKLKDYSPKFLKILDQLKQEENIGLNLIYSQFRTLEGIGIFSLVLEANGYAKFKLSKESGKWKINIAKEDRSKPKFVLYTGTESVEEKELIRKIFNGQWEFLPPELREDVILLGKELSKDKDEYDESRKNMFGEIIKIIMITASGAEGISLTNVRFVHIMEPYWHPVRIDQVIGRARRICSHQDFTDEKLKTVTVFLYLMIFTKQQKDEGSRELKNKDRSKRFPTEIYTSDQALYEIALIKEDINKDLLHNLKEASIDCVFHKKNAVGKPIQCFGFGAQLDPNKFSYAPEIGAEEKDSVSAQNQVRKTITGKEIEIDKKKYVIKKDDIEEENASLNEKSDGTVEVSLYSKSAYEAGQFTPVGIIIFKAKEIDGKKKYKPTKNVYIFNA